MKKLFWKIYFPLSICIILTIVFSFYLTFRVIPVQNREILRERLEAFREVLISQQGLTIETARAIADNLEIEADFFPISINSEFTRRQLIPKPGYVFLPGLPNNLPFIVQVSLTPANLAVKTRRLFWLWIFGLLFVEGSVLYISLIPLRRKLSRLETATVKLGNGTLGTRVELDICKSPDLIDSLAVSFNSMADRIQSLVASHQELIGSVAHELRTPLARIGLALEMTRDADSETDRQDKIERMEKDMLALDLLVSELLAFNRLGRIDRAKNPEDLNLLEIVREVVDIEGWNREDVDISISGMGALEGDRKLVARAIGNLVRNAIRHATRRVSIHILQEESNTVIDVEDDGQGIQKADWKRIGQPFLKISGNKSTGAGLGLAIASRIAVLHNGRIEIADSLLGGAKVSIVFSQQSG